MSRPKKIVARLLALCLTMAPVLYPLLIGSGLALGGLALGSGVRDGMLYYSNASLLVPARQADAQFNFNLRVFEFQKAQMEEALNSARQGPRQ